MNGDRSERTCETCEAPLEPDAACLACAFDSALSVEDEVQETTNESSFGTFVPQAVGMLGKYQLTKELGSGGMGVIWEAEDTSLQRTVAIKMIRGFAFSSTNERQRFEREATAVAQLEHPNIVPIYEVGEVEGQPYFTMKRLTGGTLSARLADRPMDQREAAQIMEKLARAIAHAHKRGVLHRDLKPDNVLFDTAGEPHLTDFGLAKMLDEGAGLTLTTAHVGTPHYMSPEQARGQAKDITTASDVWGAGALFYHMLNGQVPFPGASSGEVLDRVANQDPAQMIRSSDQIDPQLETLCLRCMQKDPKDRLPSADALADDLERWLAGQPIESKAVSPTESTLRWARRHPWQLATALALACLLTVVVFLATSPQDRKLVVPINDPPQSSKAASIPSKFKMETYSIDGARDGPRFFVGWFGQAYNVHGIIPDYSDNDTQRGSYIFDIEKEDLDGGVALKVVNYHLAEDGKNYYLPNLTHEPVVYTVTEPLWNQGVEPDLEFISLQYKDHYLRHSGRKLYHHAPLKGGREKSRRIFQQDSTWTVHPLR